MTQVESCLLGPMAEYVGEITQAAGQGYELLSNGKKVNTAEAVFYTRRQAKQNCRWNHKNHKWIEVECRYNGMQLNPN